MGEHVVDHPAELSAPLWSLHPLDESDPTVVRAVEEIADAYAGTSRADLTRLLRSCDIDPPVLDAPGSELDRWWRILRHASEQGRTAALVARIVVAFPRTRRTLVDDDPLGLAIEAVDGADRGRIDLAIAETLAGSTWRDSGTASLAARVGLGGAYGDDLTAWSELVTDPRDRGLLCRLLEVSLRGRGELRVELRARLERGRPALRHTSTVWYPASVPRRDARFFGPGLKVPVIDRDAIREQLGEVEAGRLSCLLVATPAGGLRHSLSYVTFRLRQPGFKLVVVRVNGHLEPNARTVMDDIANVIGFAITAEPANEQDAATAKKLAGDLVRALQDRDHGGAIVLHVEQPEALSPDSHELIECLIAQFGDGNVNPLFSLVVIGLSDRPRMASDWIVVEELGPIVPGDVERFLPRGFATRRAAGGFRRARPGRGRDRGRATRHVGGAPGAARALRGAVRAMTDDARPTLLAQAAVLDHFDVSWLEPGDAGEADVLAFVLSHCERVADTSRRRFWRLAQRYRLATWGFGVTAELAAARRAVRTGPLCTAQWAIDTVLDGSVGAPGDLDDEHLRAVRAVMSWMGPDAEVSGHSAAQYGADAERRRITGALRSTLDGMVIGRESLLDDLGRSVVDATSPQVVWGVGGIGKSTVLAELLLRRLPQGMRFAYLNFDRGLVDARRPHALLEEIVWQLQQLNPELASSELDEWMRTLRAEADRSTGLLDAASESAVADADVSEKALFSLRAIPSFDELPVVVALDSYEELQRRSVGDSYRVWDLVDRLVSVMGTWSFIAAGRARIPEAAQARHVHLDELDRADALALLRSHLGDNPRPDALLEQVVDLVRANPLSLRLAAQVLRHSSIDDVNQLLEVVDDNVHGQLYARILDHIPQEDVRRLAHPGLVLRRVDADVIVDVLAEPCGLDVDRSRADELLGELRREASLVDVADDGALIHRADVRAMMLPALRRVAPGQVAEIHRRAIDHYAARPDSTARTEEAYHRLMLDPRDERLDEVLAEADIDALVRSTDELPTASQLRLAEHAPGVELGPATLAEASDAAWVEVTRPEVRSLIRAGRSVEALAILRRRRSDAQGSLLPLEEAEILEDLGRLDEARRITTLGIDAGRARGDAESVRALTRTSARLFERTRDVQSALDVIDELIDVWLASSPPREIPRAIEELVDLTTWLRLVRNGAVPADDARPETVRTYALQVADRVPNRLLSRRTSLLRDLAAELESARFIELAVDAGSDASAVASTSAATSGGAAGGVAAPTTAWDTGPPASASGASGLVDRFRRRSTSRDRPEPPPIETPGTESEVTSPTDRNESARDRLQGLADRANRASIAIALSGAGQRGAAWGGGVLAAVVDAGLGPDVGSVSSVSGASIANGVVARNLDLTTARDTEVDRALGPLLRWVATSDLLRDTSASLMRFTLAASLVAGFVVGCFTVLAIASGPTILAAVFGVMAIAFAAWARAILAGRGHRYVKSLDRDLFGGVQLSDVLSSVDHVFAATDLEAGDSFFFAPKFLYGFRFGVADPKGAGITLATAVGASGMVPFALPPMVLDVEPTQEPRLLSSVAAPWRNRVVLSDGSICDEFAEGWTAGLANRSRTWPGLSANEGAPEIVLIATASADQNAVRSYGRRGVLRLERYGVLRALTVQSQAASAWRRRSLVRQWATPEPGNDGVFVALDQSPYRMLDALARGEDTVAERAREALAFLGDSDRERARWEKLTARTVAVGWELLGPEHTVDIVEHAYVSTVLGLYVLRGLGILVPFDRTRFEHLLLEERK